MHELVNKQKDENWKREKKRRKEKKKKTDWQRETGVNGKRWLLLDLCDSLTYISIERPDSWDDYCALNE